MKKYEGFRPLSPDEAAETPLENMWFPLESFLLQFGLTPDEATIELRAGRLVAYGQPVANGFDQLAISGKHAAAWLSCGSPLAMKARRFFTKRQPDA